MRVTVAVVPRERFSSTEASLESLLEHTTLPHKLVVVDGGSPAEVRDYLRAKAAEIGFKLVRTECLLTPNEARNLALEGLDTEFVAFVDNDVLFEPGWLEKLVACADETGAWLVGPLYLIGPPGTDVIHMAGGDMGFKEEEGRRRFFEHHRLLNQSYAEHRHEIRREAVDLVEFHTMLVRKEALEAIGPLDEGLLSADEHVDFCLLARQHGGTVYLEPECRVTHVLECPASPADRAYYLLRWSPEWNQRTLDHFASKWNVDRRSLRNQARWMTRHRRKGYRKFAALDPVLLPWLTWGERRRRAQWLRANRLGAPRM